MKMLLAIALLFGLASFTSAHAEWEILDTGSAVYAGAVTSTVTATAAPVTTGAAKEVSKNNATSS
jgi:hypothetical protein